MVKSMGQNLRELACEMSYNETIDELKATILEASFAQGKLVNPLYSDHKKLTTIMCTWNQMYRAMKLAEKEWTELKSSDIIFLDSRRKGIKNNLSIGLS
jgi:hypothetical protein